MSISIDNLIELYKTTLEELRHHDRVHIEVLAGMVIAVSVVVGATPFLLGLGEDSPIADTWRLPIKAGIFLLAVVMGFLFASFSGRLHQRWEACVQTLHSIEAKLRGQSVQELEGLLVRKEIEKLSGDTLPKGWWPLKHLRVAYWWLVFFLYVGLVLFLFVAIS